MISIYLNEAVHLIESRQSLQDFLQTNVVEQHFSVAVNNQIISCLAYSTTKLFAGDRVDIIVPMRGG